ncbi:MAG TPA: hypothetical protein VHD63_03920 [Ktedonobacteraceae bacterium]|nr:hypothetical protein [Ktedonobacteraceae bacterium]
MYGIVSCLPAQGEKGLSILPPVASTPLPRWQQAGGLIVLGRWLTVPGEPAARRYHQDIWDEEAANAGLSIWPQLRRTMLVWGRV